MSETSTLIFGGTGFIGRHLCVAMQAKGMRGLVVSRTPAREFLRDFAPGFDAQALADFDNSMDYHFEQAETLIYAASSSVPTTFRDRPWLELLSNVSPAFELLSRAHKVNPDIRIVFLSSGGTVYGRGYTEPIPESAPLKPISPYGYGKLVLEETIKYLGLTRNLNYAILRISNPVGQWQTNPTHGIVNVALRAALTGGSVSLFNGGSQIRDFLDADDLAEAIISSAVARECRQVIWNVGSGVGTKIADVVDLVGDICGKPIKRELVDARSVDVEYAVVDPQKINTDLGWAVQTSLVDSIKKQIKRI